MIEGRVMEREGEKILGELLANYIKKKSGIMSQGNIPMYE